MICYSNSTNEDRKSGAFNMLCSFVFAIFFGVFVFFSSVRDLQAQQELGIGTSPDKFDYGLVNPDSQISGLAHVYNGGEVDLMVEVSVDDFNIAESAPMKEWVEINENLLTFELKAKTTKKIPYKLNIPAEATPGSHSANIIFKGVPTEKNPLDPVGRTLSIGHTIYALYPGGDFEYSLDINEFNVYINGGEEILSDENGVKVYGDLKQSPDVKFKKNFPFIEIEKNTRNEIEIDFEIGNSGNVYMYPDFEVWAEKDGEKISIKNSTQIENVFPEIRENDDKTITYFLGNILTPGKTSIKNGLKFFIDEEYLFGEYEIKGKFIWNNLEKQIGVDGNVSLDLSRDSAESVMSKNLNLVTVNTYPVKYIIFLSLSVSLIVGILWIGRRRIGRVFKALVSSK